MPSIPLRTAAIGLRELMDLIPLFDKCAKRRFCTESNVSLALSSFLIAQAQNFERQPASQFRWARPGD
jgi:hypothetical protein